FQQVIRLPADRRPSGETEQTWMLPPPVGQVTLSGAGDKLDDASELTFRSGGFQSRDEAEGAGESLRGWLRLASALEGGGFDTGTDVQMSGIGNAYRPSMDALLQEQDAYLVEDVAGLLIYKEKGGHPVRFAIRGSATLLRS